MAGAERRQQRQGFLYVDTSALVRLLVREAESEALEVELLGWPQLVTSLIWRPTRRHGRTPERTAS